MLPSLGDFDFVVCSPQWGMQKHPDSPSTGGGPLRYSRSHSPIGTRVDAYFGDLGRPCRIAFTTLAEVLHYPLVLLPIPNGQGRAKVTMTSDDGAEAIARIVCSDEFFGESCLVGERPHNEAAVAMDDVVVMAWTSSEIERQIEQDPHLGIALSQYLVAQCMELQDRIQSAACYKIPERIMVALAQLATHLGAAMPDGTTRIPGTTHHVIAQFVGTSREIVTFHMNRLRQTGMMTYSRRHIDIDLAALFEELRQRGVTLPHVARGKQPALSAVR